MAKHSIRTDFLTKAVGLTDEFSDHLKIIWKLTPEERSALIPPVVELQRLMTTGQIQAIKERFLAEWEGDQTTCLKSIQVLDYIAGEWNPMYDTPEAFVDDLRDLSLLPKKAEEEAAGFLLEFFSALQQDNERRLASIYANSVIPAYSGMAIVLDVRPVFDKPFGSGREDKLEKYAPEFIGVVPVIVVKIRRTGGERALVFQCTEMELDRIIDILSSTKKDLKEARAGLTVNWIEP